MSIQRAEQLKRELTDKSVMVTDNVAELRRFAGLVGRVITVNMNGRALVQFNGPADVGWYDIDPSYLQIVSAPVRKVPEHDANDAPVRPASKTVASSAKSAAAEKPAAKPAAAADDGGKKLSPLELARQQGAASAAKPAAAAAPASAKPAAAPAADGGKKLSPLELARQQGAAKKEGGAPAAAAAPAPAPAPPAPAPKPAPPPAPKPAPAPAPKPSSPPSGAKLSTAEILALARQQDSKS